MEKYEYAMLPYIENFGGAERPYYKELVYRLERVTIKSPVKGEPDFSTVERRLDFYKDKNRAMHTKFFLDYFTSLCIKFFCY